MSKLKGARMLVVGGTGNVGRHLVRALLAQGASVVVPSRTPEKLDALRKAVDPDAVARLVGLAGDITDENDTARLLSEAGELDGAVASLGGFVAAPSVLDAPPRDLDRVFAGYVHAHLAAARAVIPRLVDRGGGYVMINGPLAFDPLSPGAGLVSIATAAQAMLARVLMKELAETRLRLNEVVIYSSFGWGQDERNVVTGEDIGRYVARLLSAEGAKVRGQSLHLRGRPELVTSHKQ